MGTYRNYRVLTDREIRNAIINEGRRYKNELRNKSILFLFDNTDKGQLDYLEVEFLDSNYQHLTGVGLLDDNGNIKKYRAKEFF